MTTATLNKPKPKAKKTKLPGGCYAPSEIPAKWRAIIEAIPNYSPIETAEAGQYFDTNAAQLALDFFPECLHHVEGAKAGEPFVLEGWQQSPIANIFGWMRADGTRRYRRVLWYVPRKNGKTPLVAGIACYVFFCDAELGQQNYVAAAETKQAGLMFRWIRGMIIAEPQLMNRCQIYGGRAGTGHKAIVNEQDDSYIHVISADAHTKHGQNPHLIILEELHAQPDRRLYDTLKTGGVSANRRQPLFMCVTTADFMRESICNEEYDYASKVRDNIVQDSAYLPVIHEADKGDDWTKPETWRKANPNLGVSVSEEALATIVKEAQERPQLENEVKRLHLNIRTEQATRWLSMEHWNACTSATPDTAGEWRARKLKELAKRECYGGLDLGSTSDLTALLLLFAGADDEPYVLLPWFWVPREGLQRKDPQHRALYDAWVRQGFVEVTPGNVADYDRIGAEVIGIAGGFGLRELRVDRLFQGAQLCTQLMNGGLNVVSHGQGFLSMAAPSKHFEERVLQHGLDHGCNPVLTWMASNVNIATDPAGNIKPVKAGKNSPLKIDGIVCGIMALAGQMAQAGAGHSVYDDPNYGL